MWFNIGATYLFFLEFGSDHTIKNKDIDWYQSGKWVFLN